MSNIKLFKVSNDIVNEIVGTSIKLETKLQRLIETNLEALLGIRFLASEYSTGTAHGDRIDTLGIDENGRPVIIKYKRSSNENIVTQGLYYLDWLMDHQKDFAYLVSERLEQKTVSQVEWSAPRLLCIAGNFTKFDERAIKQMKRNIELIRYRQFADDLLLFENVTVSDKTNDENKQGSMVYPKRTSTDKVSKADQEISDWHEEIRSYLMNLGDDVQERCQKYVTIYKRSKNFAVLEPRVRKHKLLVHVKISPDTIDCEAGFTRDRRGMHAWGPLEITISSQSDIERVKPLLKKSYDAS